MGKKLYFQINLNREADLPLPLKVLLGNPELTIKKVLFCICYWPKKLFQ